MIAVPRGVSTLSDGLNMIPLSEMKSLLRTLMGFDKLAKA
jgi:3-deoxy-D-manno-octulosonic acid (KDO) 8-phosphate synthase